MAQGENGLNIKRPLQKTAQGENGPARIQVSESHLEPPNLLCRCFEQKYASLREIRKIQTYCIFEHLQSNIRL